MFENLLNKKNAPDANTTHRVFIGRDDKAIADAIAGHENLCQFAQQAYDGFANAGIDLTLDEAVSFVNNLRSDHFDIVDFVLDKLVDKAGTFNLNGVNVDREKLKGILAVPDLATLSAVKTTFTAAIGYQSKPVAFKAEMLQMEAGIISVLPDAKSTIEAQYSYYTSTEKGAKLARLLTTIAEALEAHDELTVHYHARDAADKIPGLIRRPADNGTISLDYYAIQQMEGKA